MPSRQFQIAPDPPPQPHRTHIPLAPPIVAGAGLFSSLLICFLFCKKWRPSSSPDSNSNQLRRYSLKALKKATGNFSDSTRVGQGGFGSVYVGKVKGTEQVAVKVMDSGSLQGEREFQNELVVAERIESRYVLKLLGFAASRKRMVLVYEFMSNGSLQDALFMKKDVRLRDWECRFTIALDVAKGIEYLHSCCDPAIVHCDVKPSNVLLDGEMRAKIGDFGLARFKEGGEGIKEVVVEDGASVMEETESVTTMTMMGLDDFIVCMDQSPESFCKVLGDEASPVRSELQSVVFPKINEGTESVEGGKEIVVVNDERNMGVLEGRDGGQQQGSGAVKEYVMEWIGKEVKKERPKSGWIGDSSSTHIKAKYEKKKKKKQSDWWVSLDEEKSAKKNKRRPAREWWKEEYCNDLAKKQKKKKRPQSEITDDEYVDTWWPRNEGSSKGRKFSRNQSKSSRASLDWWLDGLSGESWRGRHNSHDSGSGEIPKSSGMSSTPSMRGTVCYVAPEYGGGGEYGNFSEKCDVYSYGVLLLVIIAGRRPLQVTGSPMEFKRANLVSWARRLARAGKLHELVDKSLLSVNQDQALLCIKVALLCLQKSPAKRPSMKEVVGMLSGVLELPQLPYELSLSTPSRHPLASHKKVR